MKIKKIYDKIMDKDISRKKFVQLIGLSFIGLTFLSKDTLADIWLRDTDSSMTNLTDLKNHLTTLTSAHNSEAIDYDNTTSGLTATNVKNAIDELSSTSGGIPKVDTLPSPSVKGDVVFLNTDSNLYVGVEV